MSNIFGKTLDPRAELKTPFAMKGKKPCIKVSHNPSTINQKEDLYVDVPHMGENDVIFLRLLFDLELTGTNTKRTIVSNIGNSLVQTLKIKINSNEVQNTDDYNVLPIEISGYRNLSMKII